MKHRIKISVLLFITLVIFTLSLEYLNIYFAIFAVLLFILITLLEIT
jgi:hypothetical protein